MIIHKTKDGERIDSIAYKYYGDASLVEPIIRENPSLAESNGVFPVSLDGEKEVKVPYVLEPAGDSNPSPEWSVD